MIQDLITFIGRFHPLWVHLPIGFLIIAVFFKAYMTLGKKPAMQEAVNFSLLLGTISALIAAVLGFLLSQSGGYEDDLLDVHVVAGWMTVIISAIAWWINKHEDRFSKKLNYIVLGFMILALSVTGHFGGSLTHGEDYLTAYAPFGEKQKETQGRVLDKLEDAEVFTDVIQPVLRSKCQSCHRPGKTKGELNLVSYETMLQGGENGPVFIAADAEKSELIRRVTLPSDHDDFMPAEGKKPLTEEEIQVLIWWIAKGKADPKISLMDADEAIIAWAKPRLNILGTEKLQVVRIDTVHLKALEKMGFRVRILSHESGALDVVLPSDAAKDRASELLKALLPVKDQIYWLSLAETGLQDYDLNQIAQFSNLHRLRIENNPITDSGISALSSLSKLESLNLNGTKVSEAGLETLAEIQTLKSLYLWNTAIDPKDEKVGKIQSIGVRVVFGS
ncbi:Uncharacterized membrane protein [Aquiflexum balticum DSM 16537]|uniref:Uncharacterized membrane protein n=1 Tax=Aquiflexum balticum DSM 16537 TaxID=758820 RepID=A0A1W2H1K3_9BACT|nr:DUF2231 domain-containing protein [Aquiflexum balticum]SMD42366.1 Uncharacterized membrane protein [Aquiflexum balticum DSM 16537]